MMSLVLVAIGILMASALAALLLARAPRLATICGVGGALRRPGQGHAAVILIMATPGHQRSGGLSF